MKPYLVSIFLFILFGCLAYLLYIQLDRGSKIDPNKQSVVVTFYPLYEFTKQVGGEAVEVVNLTPAGSEPHNFDPLPNDIATLGRSKLFIYNGAGLDTWVERVIPDLEKRDVSVLDMSKAVPLENVTDQNESDPHFWLDPVIAQQEVSVISKRLQQVDPYNSDLYEKNATRYIEELKTLDTEFETTLKTCKTRNMVASHDAYGYFARRYNLRVVPIAGLSPEEEPSPARLAEIVQFVRDNAISYIFFESLVSPKLSETIAAETGAKTLVFNPIEGLTPDNIEQGQNYLTLQRDNLSNLKIALECQ
jgi:zinc transport system substrate-binding protein